MDNVSVIIPCYNAAAWIRETLDSVFAQEDARAQQDARAQRDAQFALQVIVVDDGSTDVSAEIVAGAFPQVELIRTENRGARHARNRGLAAARGEWIQFLDADDQLPPGKLVRQLDALRASAADVVYGDWQYVLPATGGGFELGPVVAHQIGEPPELALFTHFWAPLSAYLFRRRTVDLVGEFDAQLPILEDAHFVLDCALRGAQFLYLPGVASLYRVHGAQTSRNRVAFVQDLWTQILQTQEWWNEHGGVTPARRAALLEVEGNLARMSYETDRAIFWKAVQALEAWSPHYVPGAPRSLKYLAQVFGYPRAEEIARRYRQLKRAGLGLVGRLPREPQHAAMPRE